MKNILDWYEIAGVTEFTWEIPINRFAESKEVISKPDNDLKKEAETPAVSFVNVEAMDLSELKLAMAKFNGTNLKKTAKNMVFGDGLETAKIMFIGEAPGEEEDRQGKPFVGKSGQLLDKMMASIGLDRTNSYISNIVPYRPPNNMTPSAEDINAFLPFIRKHIEIVNPKIIVMLGAVSAKALLNKSAGISALRGDFFKCKVSDTKEITAYATFHPSYLLRNPVAKRLVWKDLLEIKKFLDNL